MIAAAVALWLSVHARAEPAAPPPFTPADAPAAPVIETGVPPVPAVTLPAETPPAPGGTGADRPRWRFRTLAGGTTMRLGGLDRFSRPALKLLEADWKTVYGAAATESHTRVNFGMVAGFEAAYELDPMVSVAARISRVVAQEGRVHTEATGGGYGITDDWIMNTDLVMIGGGAGFHLPLVPRTRLNITLVLGAGLANARLDHQLTNLHPDGNLAFEEATVDSKGTTFIPEFAAELEHVMTESVTVGVAAGYRFGGIESFTSRHASAVNVFSAFPEIKAGAPVRDASGTLLAADYSGLVLTVFLAARL